MSNYTLADARAVLEDWHDACHKPEIFKWLVDEVAAKDAQIKRLREALKLVEWCIDTNREGYFPKCPICRGRNPSSGTSQVFYIGHKPGCEIAAALKEGE